MIATWQAPLADGKTSEELLVAFDEARARRILIVPALFDEANKMRRQTVNVMRLLDQAGCDSFLPDLPGCNESLAALRDQTLSSWRAAILAASQRVKATHVLTLRGGALLAPSDLPGWQYAPQSGAKLLRAMIRARILSAREAGIEETSENLIEMGRQDGLVLAGWPLSAAMISELETAEPVMTGRQKTIAQHDLGGGALWLRAEADESMVQAEALVAIITANDETCS